MSSEEDCDDAAQTLAGQEPDDAPATPPGPVFDLEMIDAPTKKNDIDTVRRLAYQHVRVPLGSVLLWRHRLMWFVFALA